MSVEERVVRFNKEFTRMFGYEPAEVFGRTIQDIIVPEANVAAPAFA